VTDSWAGEKVENRSLLVLVGMTIRGKTHGERIVGYGCRVFVGIVVNGIGMRWVERVVRGVGIPVEMIEIEIVIVIVMIEMVEQLQDVQIQTLDDEYE
jgi:hypothetical protein